MKDGDDIHEHVWKFSDKIYELNEMEVDRNVDLQVWMFLFSASSYCVVSKILDARSSPATIYHHRKRFVRK